MNCRTFFTYVISLSHVQHKHCLSRLICLDFIVEYKEYHLFWMLSIAMIYSELCIQLKYICKYVNGHSYLKLVCLTRIMHVVISRHNPSNAINNITNKLFRYFSFFVVFFRHHMNAASTICTQQT